MITVAVLSRKGGIGKSTVVVNLAVAAESSKIIDADPQCTVSSWGDLRQESSPEVLAIPAARLPQAVSRINAPWIFIDTPPSIGETAAQAAAVADLILVVAGPNQWDLDAIGSTIATASATGKPHWLLLNKVHPSANPADLLADLEAIAPICPFVLRHRAAYPDATVVGQGVMEVDPAGKAAEEVRLIWGWLQEVANG